MATLMGLPTEIRRHIFSYLVTPQAPSIEDAQHSGVYQRDYHEYEKSSSAPKGGANVLKFRNCRVGAGMRERTKYKVRSGRLRSACEDASYACVNLPRLHTGIMLVSQQARRDAAELLYSTYTFDFDTHVEACVPFLADLTPLARGCVRRVSVVKRALPYEKDFDRCEWAGMCRYLATNVSLWELSLGVVAGKPALGWEGLRAFRRDDFELVTRMEEMGWVNELAGIKGLRSLDVRACIEHSPPPCSSSLAFFVTFSASVEPGFADYLNGVLIEQAA